MKVLVLHWIIPIYKKGPRCNNYRCISVTSVMGRCYDKVIKNIVEEECSPYDLDQQAGFKAGCSCVDHIFTFHQILEKKATTKKETC